MLENMENNILEKLKQYFKNTPRDKVLSDWKHTKENAPKNSPLLKDFLKNN